MPAHRALAGPPVGLPFCALAGSPFAFVSVVAGTAVSTRTMAVTDIRSSRIMNASAASST